MRCQAPVPDWEHPEATQCTHEGHAVEMLYTYEKKDTRTIFLCEEHKKSLKFVFEVSRDTTPPSEHFDHEDWRVTRIDIDGDSYKIGAKCLCSDSFISDTGTVMFGA
jgi:hypothetical protein